MNTNNLKKYNLMGVIVAIVGLSLCIALIQEFFGSAGAFVESLCSTTGDGDSCSKVAKSAWSGFRGLPVLGDVPVAHIGFTFYGFCGFLFFAILRADEEEKKGFVNLLFAVSLLGIVIDVILLIISVSQIGTVCVLCALTYVVTIGIFVLAYLQAKSYSGEEGIMSQVKLTVGKNIATNFLNYTIVVLLFFAGGIACARLSTPNKTSNEPDPESNKIYLQTKIEAFEKRPAVKIDLSQSPGVGSPNAKITIVKYADFNCGHCMHTSHIISQLLADFPNDIKVYYKNFPLDGTCNPLVQRKDPSASSCIAASAALCANKQGKFKEVYTGLYADNENGVRHTISSVKEIANKAGANMQQLQACMGSTEIQNFILAEVKEGEVLNIQSTPSLYINNKALDPGTPNPNFLKALVEHLLKK
ncbi:MAG: thioredoxin domain-containing protein [Leptospiraceae bacterium]|nr:thioredoxin domain-containing protein [Leptospiraceae bacterium]MBK7053704.1 thioredoxin domain-containing protein [Leptospiraceae bacterium]MBK9500171.1 thioredoxin domain-containing protein [Leptospiraceae bacterium]MBL0264278.1 thioredoxin domain-containing protein [Leptospiraceae bacterium]MBP9163448.1 thioredoxin domain-containing protein [Leptospiraceae bacterium]